MKDTISPKVDTRNFQEFMQTFREKVPYYVPEWDPGEENGPGASLLKIFVHMQEDIINRLNRVPARNFTAFLEMLGIKLIPSHPARVPVTCKALFLHR